MRGSKVQVFFLHFAGGSCYSFDFLRSYLKNSFEFIPLELPGRGKRYSEQLIKAKNEAVEDYYSQLISLRNGNPYLIFGHSMGAVLGFDLVAKMEKLNDLPICLIVSGNPGPGIKEVLEDDKKIGKRYLMSDESFKDELRKMGGVPEEILENSELYNFFNPILRADFEVLENEDFIHSAHQLSTPIYAMMGSEEKYSNKINNWRKYTNKPFQYKLLSGGHFFINDHAAHISDIIFHLIQKKDIIYN